MKKLLPLFVVGILVLGGLGAVSISNNKTNDLKIKTESIVISDPVIKNTGQYVALSLEEATSSLLNPGKPMLPVVTRVFTFPFGTKIDHVYVSFFDTKELTLSKEVQPAPEPVPLDVQVANEPVKDEIVYESAALYPTSSYSYITGAGLDGEEHVIYLTVQCYPIRYSPAKNMIYYNENAEIQVVYEEPATPTLFLDQYDLVIISPSEFLGELQPLVDHKNSKSVNTTLKTTEAIYSEYNGYDQAEKIKYFIKDAIETWGIDYVLLVGSIDKLPIRKTWFFQKHHEYYWNETILSDLYYSDIYDEYGEFCSWDSNNNGMYGESYRNCPGVDDIVDLYPDVNIGRLACQNGNDVNTVVDKIIYYETNTYGKAWFNKILLIGGDTFPGWNGNEGEILNNMVEQIMSDFTPTKLWTSDGTFNPQKINEAINKGAGFIDYSGHGFETGVGTHPPNNDSWIFYENIDLIGALNGYKLPIIFFDACLTARLDYNKSKLVPSCFAWNCVKKIAGGAIATIGATRTAFGGIDSGAGKISLEFFSAYENSETLGQMMTRAQNEYITDVPDDLFTVEEFILIGDPSLKVGGYKTKTNNGPQSISRSQQSQSNPQGNPSPNQQSNPIIQQINQLVQRIKITNQQIYNRLPHFSPHKFFNLYAR
jgi:hypothetical protein